MAPRTLTTPLGRGVHATLRHEARRWRAAAAALGFLVFAVALGPATLRAADAQQAQPPRNLDEPLVRERLAVLKAGAVRHLPGHTEWPENRFNDENERRDPIVVTIVGEDGWGFERYVERVTAGQRAQNRTLLVRLIQYPRPRPGEEEPAEEDLEAFRRMLLESHVLYIGLTEERDQRFRRIIDWVNGRSILTVSSIRNFAERGGMLGVGVRENRLALDANVDLIRAAELKVSSSLLRLARIVTSPDARPAADARD